MIRNDSLIDTTERFYRLFQQSKKRQIDTERRAQKLIIGQGSPSFFPHFVDAETKITRLNDSEFTQLQEGVELLTLWGDSQTGPSGSMLRFTSNIPEKIYCQTNMCFVMIISGGIKYKEGVRIEKEVKILLTGDSCIQKAGNGFHIENYPTGETTLLYMHCDSPISYVSNSQFHF